MDYAKKIVQGELAFLARGIIRRYKPLVVGITGSVGKTSAKEAICVALRPEWDVRQSQKNYNNEFGVPLTVIGCNAPGKNPVKWMKVFGAALELLLFRKAYPNMLVLELGVDRPGDMDRLADIVRPQVAVLTAIGTAHIEFFGSEENILKEKIRIAKHLGPAGIAIVNYDDPPLRASLTQFAARGIRTITYGLDAGADVRAEFVSPAHEDGEHGMHFTLVYGPDRAPVFVSGAVGIPHVLACLAGAAVAIAMGEDIRTAAANLGRYVPQRGRMRVLSGREGSVIIDDSYNASPQAVLSAIQSFASYPAHRKVAILGDMLELGDHAEAAHRGLALPLIEAEANEIILVGSAMRSLAEELIGCGYPAGSVRRYDTAAEAAEHLAGVAAADTVILVKGSQGTRMERVIKALLADPSRAPHLLVRQDQRWLRRT